MYITYVTKNDLFWSIYAHIEPSEVWYTPLAEYGLKRGAQESLRSTSLTVNNCQTHKDDSRQ